MELVRAGSWDKGLKKLKQRCGLLGHSHSSCARRASGWNTYGSPLTLYPSHAVLPGPREQRLMTRHLATALVRGKGKWCPLVVYTALGPLFGIRGGPRCPVATARTTGALAWRRDDVWGVPLAGQEMAAWWAKAVLWARAPLDIRIPAPARARLVRLRTILRQADLGGFWQRDLVRRRTTAAAAYVAVWIDGRGDVGCFTP